MNEVLLVALFLGLILRECGALFMPSRSERLSW